VTTVDPNTSPGNAILENSSTEQSDQVSSPAALSTTNNLSATVWTGQTFRPGRHRHPDEDEGGSASR
jgi:hypothetical protein